MYVIFIFSTLLENLYLELINLLSNDKRLISEGKLLRNKVVELAYKLDKDLIKLLLSNPKFKEIFFQDIDGILIFDQNNFQILISNKEFLPDSFTSFKNKIGLTNENNEYISQSKEVVLSFPYKDCVLEGGQDKEDVKRDEIFYNKILASDEIDRLFEPKVLTNFKKFDKNGEQKVDGITEKDNLIIKGNNLLALHSLKQRLVGQIKLIYIDPPYNTGNDGFKYNDNFNHSTWLTFMKNRIEIAKELLRADGFMFIHISQHEFEYLKVLLNEIFNNEGTCVFNVLVRHPERILKKDKEYHDVIEYILVYTKNKILNKLPQISVKNDLEEYIYKIIEKTNGKQVVINGKEVTIFEPSEYEEVQTTYSKDNYKKISIRGSLKEGNSSGRYYTANIEPNLYQYKPGSLIKVKNIGKDSFNYRYFYTPNEGRKNGGYYQGVPLDWVEEDKKPYPNFFDFVKEYNNVGYEGGVDLRNAKKPEALLMKLINMVTKENDIVMDYHLGSGTTCAVAHKMNRQYIGIEQMDYGENDSINRLKNVINGDQTGISKTVQWMGGGSFICCELFQSNQKFIDRIESSNDLIVILEKIKQNGFLTHKVDFNKLNSTSFNKLTQEEQRMLIIELIDANHLYLNLNDMDDVRFEVSEEDKRLNRQFYSI